MGLGGFGVTKTGPAIGGRSAEKKYKIILIKVKKFHGNKFLNIKTYQVLVVVFGASAEMDE